MNDIKVIITQNKAAGAVGFGVPLLFAGVQEAPVPYTVCAGMDEVEALFAPESPFYRAAQRIFMQEGAPAQIAVCASGQPAAAALDSIFDNDWRQLVVLSLGESRTVPGTTGDAGAQAIYAAAVTEGGTPLAAGDTVEICGKVYTIHETDDTGGNISLALADTFAEQLGEALERFSAQPGGKFTAAYSAGAITFTAKAPGAIAAGDVPTASISGEGYAVGQMEERSPGADPVPGTPETVVEESTPEEIARYLEGRSDKLFFAGVDRFDSLGAFKTLARTVLFYHPDDRDFPVCALVGASAGKPVGGFTYKNLRLKGVEPVRMTDTAVKALHEAGALTVLQKAGDIVSSEGMTTSGEYIDLIDSRDYIIKDLAYRAQRLLNSADKVPYDNNGIAMLEGVAVTVLQEAYQRGMIAVDDDGLPDFSVAFAKRSETLPGDRAKRQYLGGKFRFGLAGAVHTAEIRGEIII